MHEKHKAHLKITSCSCFFFVCVFYFLFLTTCSSFANPPVRYFWLQNPFHFGKWTHKKWKNVRMQKQWRKQSCFHTLDTANALAIYRRWWRWWWAAAGKKTHTQFQSIPYGVMKSLHERYQFPVEKCKSSAFLRRYPSLS